jgi:hypothetical protein
VIAFSRLLLVASLVGALGGCSEFRIKTQYDQDADFASMQSYAWSSSTVGGTGTLGAYRELLDARVHATVDAELAHKGYRLTSDEEADFLVAYRSTTKHKLESADLDGQRGYGAGLGRADDFGAAFGGGSGSIVEEYEEGKLIISVLSPDTGRPLWTGAAKAALDPDASAEARRERIGRATARIMRSFPP